VLRAGAGDIVEGDALLTLARIRLAQGRSDEAREILARPGGSIRAVRDGRRSTPPSVDNAFRRILGSFVYKGCGH
jgi:hypothetical protein